LTAKVISELSSSELRQLRPRLQIVFQDPISSLNPRCRVAVIIAEPLEVWKRTRSAGGSDQVQEMMTAVGLDYHSHGQRRPHELSGGHQRVSIARALMLNPDLQICDEPVSALDVSVQAQILNLLEDMKSRYGLTMIFIAHDLAVVHNVADRVAVMYLGKIVEAAHRMTSTGRRRITTRPASWPAFRRYRRRRTVGVPSG
jgi:peptide/nickel transport system ATP-binding protein